MPIRLIVLVGENKTGFTGAHGIGIQKVPRRLLMLAVSTSMVLLISPPTSRISFLEPTYQVLPTALLGTDLASLSAPIIKSKILKN